jgi:hypothetical protein
MNKAYLNISIFVLILLLLNLFFSVFMLVQYHNIENVLQVYFSDYKADLSMANNLIFKVLGNPRFWILEVILIAAAFMIRRYIVVSKSVN